MKTSPITFIDHLDPELLKCWKKHLSIPHQTVKADRTPNLKMERSSIAIWSLENGEQQELLCLVEVTNVPQQDKQAAMNCSIHIPGIAASKTLLMVFKNAAYYAEWSEKIVQTVHGMIENNNRQNPPPDTPAPKETTPPSTKTAEAKEPPPSIPAGLDVFADPLPEPSKTKPSIPPPPRPA